MSNFLLIGPSAGGKTTILSAYKPKLNTGEYHGTPGQEKVSIGILGFGGNILEIGGNDHNINDSKKELEKGKRTVLFVFDGNVFLDQIRNPRQGGTVYSRWMHYKKYEARPYFVATHADLVSDMKNKILNEIRSANEEYMSLVGKERYEMKWFEEPFFYCINARDKEQVKSLIKQIKG